jgi:hypothetical protein
MASPKSKLSIHAARMNCLAGCFECQAPLTYLFEFQEKLRDLGWQEPDVEAVITSVLPLLQQLNRGDRVDAGDTSMAAT